jgi:valyl-tRNA synthetase
MVPLGEKDDVILEPMLTKQWFCNMDEFAKTALQLVESGQIKFVPENWQVIYNQWLENIQDWCISRQLWWGHRIPAYYDEAGNHYIAENLAAAVSLAGTDKLTQDEDVLDTWFSSALWCFSPLGWPQNTQELSTFLPSNVLVTGFDIIFFWVARMVMFTHKFTHQVPFKEVFITGLILDAHGQKMSKSKGNVIDPLDLVDGISVDDLVAKRTANLLNPKATETIAKATYKDYPNGFAAFGADAVRFAFAALSTHSREIRFDVKRIEGSRNFCNKIWNASRFVLMNIEHHRQLIGQEAPLGLIDKWILGLLNKLIQDTDYAYQTYRFDLLAQKIYEFSWNEYCDWYLELAKVNLASDDVLVRTATVNTLLTVLETILRIMHPLMPFISEELWQEIAPLCNKKNRQALIIAEYPKPDQHFVSQDKNINANIELLKQLCSTIRNLRAEMNVPLSNKVPLEVEARNDHFYLVNDLAKYIKSLARLSEVRVVDSFSSNTPIAVLENVRLRLDVVVDNSIQRERIEKEIDKATKELDKVKLKLDNPAYIERAPKHLVDRDTALVNELSAKIAEYRLQLNML